MLWAIIYLVFLLVCGIVGFVLAYLVWGLIQGEDLSIKIAQLRRDLFQDNPLAQDLRGRLEETKDLVLAKSGEIMSLRGDADLAEREQSSLEKRVAEATASLSVGEAEQRDLRDSLRDKDELASEMNRKLAALEGELATRARDIEDIQRRIAERAPQIVDLERRLASAEKASEARADERTALAKDHSGLQKQLEDGASTLSGLRQEEAESRKTAERERTDLARLLQEEGELSRALAAHQRTLDQGQARLPHLQQEIRDAEKARTGLQAKLEDLRSQGDTFQDQLEDAQRRAAAMQDRLDKAAEARKGLDMASPEVFRVEEERIQRVEREVGVRRQELEALAEMIPGLRRAVEAAQTEARRLEAGLAEKDEALRGLRAEMGDQRAQRVRAGSELDRIRLEADDAMAEADHLQRQVEELEGLLARGEATLPIRAEIESLLREIEANRVRLAERRKRTQLLRRNRDELRDALTRAEGDKEALAGQAEDVTARVTELRDELAEAEKQVSQAQDELKSTEDQVREREGEIRQIRDRIRVLDGKLASLNSREQELRRQLRERRAELEEEGETALRLESMIQERRVTREVHSKEASRKRGEQGAAG